MLGCVQAASASLYPDQPHAPVADERMEQPHGVGAAADARAYGVGEPAFTLQQFRPGFFADDLHELPHDERERVWSYHRTDEVVRRLDVRDPVTHRLVDRVLQRPGTTADRHNLSAHQL